MNKLKMLEDYELFTQLCEKRNITAPSDVSNAIKISSTNGELQLSCLSIMVPVCEIIAQVLSTSSTIKSVDLSDCMLLPKGLGSILNALCEGSSVTMLNIKGNNVNGAWVTLLGQVCVHNNTLKRLRVAWNSLGSHLDSFAKFCEGLAKNHSLMELDLRYNQIPPSFAASICKVLTWNKTLKSLDLSWNTLGTQGGELIMHAMRKNRSVTEIGLLGNCIPPEIVENIQECAYANQRKHSDSENIALRSAEIAQKFAANRIDAIASPKPHELCRNKVILETVSQIISPEKKGSLISNNINDDKLIRPTRFGEDANGVGDTREVESDEDDEGEETDSKNRRKRKRKARFKLLRAPKNYDSDSASGIFELPETELEDSIGEVKPEKVIADDRIEELNKILHDRTTAIEVLTAELAVKKKEIETMAPTMDDLQVEVARLKEERVKLESEKEHEISDIQKAQKEAEETWKKKCYELEMAYEKCLQGKKDADQKLRRYERDIHKSTMEMTLLKEKLVSTSRTYEDHLSKDKLEMHRLKREFKEHENRHKIEMNVLKNTLRDTTKALEECQEQLLKSRNELRELHGDHSILRSKLTETEHVVLRYTRIEENLQKVKEEKEVLEEKLADSQRSVSGLQRQVTSLQSELIEPQRRYELLKEELDREKQGSERLKQELLDERTRLKEQSHQVEKITQQVALLNARLNDLQNSHAEVMREKDKENKQLKETIARKERDLSELRAEEVQRAGQLYAAFSKYLGSLGPTPVS